MRVFVAGAAGAVGKALLPELLRRGHKVAGMVRSRASAANVANFGAVPVLANALDANAVMDGVKRFKPDAVIHQLTALPASTDLRDFDRVFAATNTLRTEGLDILIDAARQSGARRFVAQSFCGWPYARVGGSIKTEHDPFDPDPPSAFKRTLDALRYLEATVDAAGDLNGASLRYGAFYGPGTFLSAGGAMVEQVRRRQLPIVGQGGGVWSFIHVADVATATAVAVESERRGVFNVVDDEPAAVSEWLPALAAAVRAKPPIRLPAFVGKLLLPRHLFLMMTEVRGGSNAKFKETFRWQPSFSSWRRGFSSGLSPS